MEDTKIKQLIDLAIQDQDRKSEYLNALSSMSLEDKLTFGIGLYEVLAQKMHLEIIEKAQGMIEEMASDNGRQYTPADFTRMEEQVTTDFLRSRSGLQDEDKLAQLRAELMNIQQLVEDHDREISELKNKIQQ